MMTTMKMMYCIICTWYYGARSLVSGGR